MRSSERNYGDRFPRFAQALESLEKMHSRLLQVRVDNLHVHCHKNLMARFVPGSRTREVQPCRCMLVQSLKRSAFGVLFLMWRVATARTARRHQTMELLNYLRSVPNGYLLSNPRKIYFPAAALR